MIRLMIKTVSFLMIFGVIAGCATTTTSYVTPQVGLISKTVVSDLGNYTGGETLWFTRTVQSTQLFTDGTVVLDKNIELFLCRDSLDKGPLCRLVTVPEGADSSAKPLISNNVTASKQGSQVVSNQTVQTPVKTEVSITSLPISWIHLQAGSFPMGSNSGISDETRHNISISAFDINKSEVTVAMYKTCVDQKKCSEPAKDLQCNWAGSGKSDDPVNCVDWNQAEQYCVFVGGHLPTEVQWEYAARSLGQDREYPWGSNDPTCQNTVMDEGGIGCGKKGTWPVCSKPSGNTAQGLCDMAGNVWEWVYDWYGDTYFANSPVDNPKGPQIGSFRVLRGGSYDYNSAKIFRASLRSRDVPTKKSPGIGFRCVK